MEAVQAAAAVCMALSQRVIRVLFGRSYGAPALVLPRCAVFSCMVCPFC
jgi:hypothetical protein